MSRPLRVAMLGFSAFEQGALAAFLRLHAAREPAFEPVDEPARADLLLVSTDSPAMVERAQREGLVERAAFVGTPLPPEEAVAWLSRPFDPHWLLRELDVLVALRRSALLLEADTEPDDLPSDTVPAALAPVPPMPAPMPTLAPAPTPAPAPRPTLRPATPPTAPPTAPPPPVPAPSRRTRPAPLRDVVSPVPAIAPAHVLALLVDDSDIALRFLELRLQALGMQTQRASDARSASALLARHDFQVVFLDVDLGERGEQDGLMLCQQIKRGPLHLGDAPPKVVMVTAHANGTTRVRADLAGADGFLAKPLDATQLRGLLRQLGLVGFND